MKIKWCNHDLVTNLNQLASLNQKVMVFIDQNVYKLYQDELNQIEGIITTIPVSEETKTIEIVEYLYEELLINHFDRHDIIIGIGGGITLDLAGFVAGTYQRGIAYYSVPTTTLSMVDAAIGGKCGINYLESDVLLKNQIGIFYEPKMIFIDLSFTKTLDQKNYYGGLVEALKMGLTLNNDLYELVKQPKINLKKVVSNAIKTKHKVVKADFTDQDKRHVLNFGHTLAHAIETNHHLSHGEAVSIGMMKFIDNPCLKKEVKNLLTSWKMPVSLRLTKADEKSLAFDKKREGDLINVVILNDKQTYHFENRPISEVIKR